MWSSEKYCRLHIQMEKKTKSKLNPSQIETMSSSCHLFQSCNVLRIFLCHIPLVVTILVKCSVMLPADRSPLHLNANKFYWLSDWKLSSTPLLSTISSLPSAPAASQKKHWIILQLLSTVNLDPDLTLTIQRPFSFNTLHSDASNIINFWHLNPTIQSKEWRWRHIWPS